MFPRVTQPPQHSPGGSAVTLPKVTQRRAQTHPWHHLPQTGSARSRDAATEPGGPGKGACRSDIPALGSTAILRAQSHWGQGFRGAGQWVSSLLAHHPPGWETSSRTGRPRGPTESSQAGVHAEPVPLLDNGLTRRDQIQNNPSAPFGAQVFIPTLQMWKQRDRLLDYSLMPAPQWDLSPEAGLPSG